MNNSSKFQEIVVAGDIAIDWNIINIPAKPGAITWNDALPSRICWYFGGSQILAELISEVVNRMENKANWILHRAAADIETIQPDDTTFVHSYASWGLFPAKRGQSANNVWRVKEFLGVTQTADPAANRLTNDSPSPKILVLDDANLGFRSNREQWPMALKMPRSEENNPWIVVKMAKKLVDGPLWEELYSRWADRLIVILAVKDLRLSEAQVSSELSWERAAQDVVWELLYNHHVNALSRCAHVVVSFNAAGAVLISQRPPLKEEGSEAVQSTLIYDPLVIEGMWEQDYPGKIMGYNTCLTAGIVRQILLSCDQPDLNTGIKAGLTALRKLHQDGYQEVKRGSKVHLSFPVQNIAACFETVKEKPFVSIPIQVPTRLLTPGSLPLEEKPVVPGVWMILQQACMTDLDTMAEKIILNGTDSALDKIPLGKFGKLTSVDRREIESFRSIRKLINEYCTQEKPKGPLSIAVFGPPGSGKSFGVTQVARSVRPEEIEDITFNLSQFNSANELVSAFHQIRDMALSGKIPLVFWDEFDSNLGDKTLGWLRYFLAPMQDGKFMEGQLMHPLGRAIFVFAGGTSSSIGEFFEKNRGNTGAKVPDFISRLRGFVNIMGSNPTKTVGDQIQENDPYFVIRRAILLRSILFNSAPDIFEKKDKNSDFSLNIDRGVLRALIKISAYKHGARSMEAIIKMSNLAGKAHFDQSSLPSETQLDLHVDGQEFMALVQEIDLSGETLDKLAKANHFYYCEDLKANGYRSCNESDPKKEVHPQLVDFDQLATEYQESNRNVIRSIHRKLSVFGYIMIPARSNEPDFSFPAGDLEEMSRMEHDRYMEEKIMSGWKYGSVRNEALKTNPTLLPWHKMTREALKVRHPHIAHAMGEDELPEIEKEKDRNQVKRYLEILKRAGYTIVKRRKSVL